MNATLTKHYAESLINDAHDKPLYSVSVVVPVYNSEGSLEELVNTLSEVLSKCTTSFEFILVDDCSRDRSWLVLQDLAKNKKHVRVVQLMRNYGQHNALLCGVRMAKNDVILIMDDDLQHPPSQVPLLLNKLAEGYDVVYGTPIKEQHGFWRDASSQITKLVLQRAMGAATARNISSFKVFRADVSQSFKDFHGPFVNLDVLLTWGTTRFAAVPVKHVPRTIGASNYNFFKLVSHALNLLTCFSTIPLRLATINGLLCLLAGFLLLCHVFVRLWLYGNIVPGFPFLASIIIIFSGAQLLTLGVIGEYLGRMFVRTMDRPAYTVRTVHGSNLDEDAKS